MLFLKVDRYVLFLHFIESYVSQSAHVPTVIAILSHCLLCNLVLHLLHLTNFFCNFVSKYYQCAYGPGEPGRWWLYRALGLMEYYSE